MQQHDRVEVWNSYSGRWSKGFEVVDVAGRDEATTYQLRRAGDADALPGWIPGPRVRPDRDSDSDTR